MGGNKGRNRGLCLFFGAFLFFYLVFQIGNFPTFLYTNGYSFSDFLSTNYAMKDVNPYISGLSNYPPLILLISLLFININKSGVTIPRVILNAFNVPSYLKSLSLLIVFYVVLVIFACILFAVLKNKKENVTGKKRYINILVSVLIALAFLFSAPSRFLIDRGNYLLVTVIFMLLWGIFEELYPEKTVGSVFLSLAAATRIFPVYVLGTYLIEKKWKKLFLALVLGLLLLVVPLFVFKGSVISNLKEFFNLNVLFVSGEPQTLSDISGYGNAYAVYYTVGFTGFIGSLFELVGMFPRGFVVKDAWIIYLILATFAGVVVLRKEEKTWKKLYIVTALMVFLTPDSFLYNTCLMFAPILVMLMSNSEVSKADYPYYLASALMLVPKSYFYLACNWIPGSPVSYFDVNIAVIIDGFLYFGIITYYFAQKLFAYFVALKNIEENKKTKLLLSQKKKKFYEVILAVIAFVFGAYMLYFCKDNVLACHDSIIDFIDSRRNPFTKGFITCFEYGLARGRVGVIFPMMVAFRYIVNGSGNYLLIWLLQYVPIYSNIVLIGYIIGKKLNKYYGFLFAILFLGLLQIDIWHSLITCYPLDFMYGLFIMILGIYLFSEYLSKREDKTSKRNVIRLIVSMILYYESMQVYEAFIVSSLIYGWLSIGYAMNNGKGFAQKFKCFVKTILPHFLVAVLYLSMLVYLRLHPVIDVPVQSFVTEFNFKRFIISYVVLSGGMFPLVDIRMVDNIFGDGISIPGTVLGILGAIAFFIAFRYMGAFYSTREKDQRKAINKFLGVLILFGLSISMTFAFPHALLPIYVSWIVDSGVGGFVPSTICYFGWSVVIFSSVSLLAHYLSRVGEKRRLVATLLIAIVFGGSVYLTCVINKTFTKIMSSTGTAFSIKAQTIYSVMTNDTIKELHPDVIYSPSLYGVHGNMKPDDQLFDTEAGYDILLLNDYERFREVNQDYDLSMILVYEQDSEVCYLVVSDNYEDDYASSFAETSIYVISRVSGEYDLCYSLEAGDDVRVYTESVVLNGNELYEIPVSDPVLIGSIDFVRK